MQHLSQDSTLQGGKYKIEKVLGQGGFGITYLANHEMLECKVAIKEFFFKEYCDRNESTSHVMLGTAANKPIVERFQQKFIKEAKTIFKLRHPNIVQIHDIFTENGTAYYVMEYVDGESLGEIVKRVGAIPEHEAIGYVKKVGSALSYIHNLNLNHLDVKPGNIMIRKSDNQVILIDFGVAKQYDAETQEGTTTTPVGISHGYSPLEQYRSNGVQEFSPQSDVYALAATLFKLLTGNTPPEAIEIQEEGVPVEDLKAKNVSSDTINAIEAAMKSRKKRTQTVDEFIEGLGNPCLAEEVDNSIESGPVLTDENEDYEGDSFENNDPEELCEEDNIILSSTEEETTILIDNECVEPTVEDENRFMSYIGLENSLFEPVDLGLSVRWCSCNVGASSPVGKGGLYGWGDSAGNNQSIDSYDYCYDEVGMDICSTSNDICYTSSNGTWRLPTIEELDELFEECDWEWVDKFGICGYLVSSRIFPTKIFLRASGKRNGKKISDEEFGFYWSGTKSSGLNTAFYLSFSKERIMPFQQNPCSVGRSIRGVCD
ncbi:MAG: serine/threonine protein kinase [Bacteroidaceae bacterium]|nr:serine/threonine protein kinase [Bacteroidaceae bacterium]